MRYHLVSVVVIQVACVKRGSHPTPRVSYLISELLLCKQILEIL